MRAKVESGPAQGRSEQYQRLICEAMRERFQTTAELSAWLGRANVSKRFPLLGDERNAGRVMDSRLFARLCLELGVSART